MTCTTCEGRGALKDGPTRPGWLRGREVIWQPMKNCPTCGQVNDLIMWQLSYPPPVVSAPPTDTSPTQPLDKPAEEPLDNGRDPNSTQCDVCGDVGSVITEVDLQVIDCPSPSCSAPPLPEKLRASMQAALDGIRNLRTSFERLIVAANRG